MNHNYSSYEYSIDILRIETKRILSTLLNPLKFILTDSGLSRDWRGLAHLIGVKGQLIPSFQTDSISKLLATWVDTDKENATIKNMCLYLEEIDRFDVIDDLTTFLENDIEYHKQQLLDSDSCACAKPSWDILTRDDVRRARQNLGPQYYDAFLLFADEDEDFVAEIIQHLEDEYKLKLCVKDRDLEAGLLERESVLKLIADRCHKLIAIISPAFFENSVNKFFCNFGLKIGMDYEQRKFIACVYIAPSDMPRELSLYFMLDYQRVSKFGNFWEKLRECITIDQVQNGKCSKTSISEKSSSKNINEKTDKQPKDKRKLKWLRNILPKHSAESETPEKSEKKKKFWQKKSKTKVALPS